MRNSSGIVFIILLTTQLLSQSLEDSLSQNLNLKEIDQTSGSIAFGACTTKRVPTMPNVVRIADMNNDGRNDIVIGSLYYIFVYLQKSNGTLNKPQAPTKPVAATSSQLLLEMVAL